jgi:hypothetical protein
MLRKKGLYNVMLIGAMVTVSLLTIASVIIEKDDIMDSTNRIIATSRANNALDCLLKDQTDGMLENGTVIKAKGRYFIYADEVLTLAHDFPDTVSATMLARIQNGKAIAFLLESDADAAMNEASGTIYYSKLLDPNERTFPVYEYSQVNEAVERYLKIVSYESSSEHVSFIKDYLDDSKNYDLPVGCTIELEAGELTVLDNGTQKVYRTTVEKGPYTFYNITPGVGGEFYVLNNDRIVQRGHLRPTGDLRMIHSDIPGYQNVRDLGGWPCDGGTIKYNLLFRGGTAFDTNDADQNTWMDMLGIKHVEHLDTLTSPESGKKKNFEQAKKEISEILNRIFDNAISGEATYFHCLDGADRTGMIAVILEGILGVSPYDIDKDYELTSFSTLRERTNETYCADMYILKQYPGKSFRDKCVEYLLDCGLNLDKINAFRRAVIDGNPEDIQEKYLDVPPKGSNLCDPEGEGWIDGGRCSSTGEDQYDTLAYTVTNYIQVQHGDTVYVKNLHVSDIFCSGIYREDKSAISGFLLKDDKNETFIKDIDINRDWEVFTVSHENAGYIRLCGMLKLGKEDVVINIFRNGEWLTLGS